MQQQIEIKLQAPFSSNGDQSTGLMWLDFGGIKGKAGVQTGVQTDIFKIET